MNAHAAGAVHLDWPDGPSFADLSPDETARLGNVLRPLAWIDGLMTAAIVAPDEPEDWLEHIWIEEQLGKLTPSQAKAVTDTVTDQYVHIVNTLFQSPEAYRPYLSDAADQVAAATQWAAGFCFGMRLHPEPWAPLINDDDARALMVFIFCLERDEDLPEASRADSPFKDISPDRRQEMRREVAAILPEVVCALHAFSLGVDAETHAEIGNQPCVRTAPKVGRNEPCPCGSGKKHKKCCLGKLV